MTKRISIFSLIAIIISLIGIVGILTLESEYRRKEIAIRKTIGASTCEIIMRYNKYYFILLLLSFAISLPISIYFMTLWLSTFAYKIQFFWWVFAVIFVLIAIITAICVTIQFRRNAKEIPLKSLNIE